MLVADEPLHPPALAWLASTGAERATPAAGRRTPAHRPTSGRLRVNILYTETTKPCTTQWLQAFSLVVVPTVLSLPKQLTEYSKRPVPLLDLLRAVPCPPSTLFAAIGSGNGRRFETWGNGMALLSLSDVFLSQSHSSEDGTVV